VITEPDVTLTDWALAIVAGACAWRLHRHGPPSVLGRWLALFFAATAGAALLGGFVHGFFLDPGTWGARLLWPATLLAVGLTALAAWAAGALLLLRPPWTRAVIVAAAVAFGAYGALVVFVAPVFTLAVAQYVPAALFLLVALARAWARTRNRRVLEALAGLAALLAGSVVQWRGIALHPVYFTHNALYHVIAGVGLVLLFRGVRQLEAVASRR